MAEKLAIRFMDEWYIQDGFTDLRSPTGEQVDNEPKFIKSTLQAIKASGGSVKYLQLKNGCAMEETGFTAQRISDVEFGEKAPFYGICVPEQKAEREKPLADVAKVFADKFKQYTEGTKKHTDSGKAAKKV